MIVIYIDNSLSCQQVERIIEVAQEHSVIITGDHTNIPTELQKYYQEQFDFEEVEKIILTQSAREQLSNSLSVFLTNVFSVKACLVKYLEINGEISDGPRKDKSDTLFIFPGPIVPLSMGSHQRSFNMLLSLKNAGKVVDVLIPDNPNIDKSAVSDSLKCVSNRVYFFKDRRKNFSKLQLAKRGVEKRIRTKLKLDDKLPDLFSERLYKRSTESLKRWVNSLYLNNEYENIIVSYAWMLNAVEYIYHMKDSYHLICDTHDVQFYRNENILSRKERLFFDKNKEKALEIKMMNQCDSVLAISEMDRKILAENVKAKVLSVYPGFDYAKAPIKQRPVGRPIHFGFIGGGMSANVDALQYIIENWWPVIRQHSPDSQLYIAGSVGNNPRIRELSFFDRNIILMGFVKDINEFYNKIEVALNPVVVTGGLNFKSVEAVCMGKHLFTNPLGVKCLTSDFPCTVIDSPTELVSIMDKIEFELQSDKRIRASNQQKALKIFGNKATVSSLKLVL